MIDLLAYLGRESEWKNINLLRTAPYLFRKESEQI